MANHNPRTEFLNPIRDTARAKELGRRGGLASGQVRKAKAQRLKSLNEYMKIASYVDALTDAEFDEFLEEFDTEQRERVRRTFRPTKQELNASLKTYGIKFRF